MRTSAALSGDWYYDELTTIAARVHGGEVSAVALTTAMLERIASVDQQLGAYILVTAEQALSEAAAADRAIAGGAIASPLHGVPIAVKDICDIAGLATTAGMGIRRDHVADSNATVIKRLRAAGAIVLGKLTLTEGVYAEHRPAFPAPQNPWHADYWPGASSTGSGVAVAAGLCFGAVGSETGGSIRLPSAVNGVTGVKPTWGRVSRHGIFELAATLDHVGPLARSAADAAALLGVMAGPDSRDPTAAQVAVPDYAAALRQQLDGFRLGIDPRWVGANTDAETLAALDRAVTQLGELGADIVEVRVPDVDAMIWDWFPICAVQTAVAHAATYPARKDEYGPALQSLLDMGHAMSGMDYQSALLRRIDFSGRLQVMLQDIDALALPVLGFPAPSLERMHNIDDDIIAGLHRYTCPFNLSGNPAIVLPNGNTAAGLPIVFQLIGKHFDEALLLGAGHAFQHATDWHRRHPAV